VDKEIFAFTLTTKQDCFEKGDCVFASDGDTIGRVLRRLKVEVDPENVFYSYDIESTKNTYQLIESGEKQLYRVSECHVSPCSTWYTRK
jgi:hypothetical protein